MESVRIQQNSTERIRLTALDVSGVGVTGATIALSIRRDSDGYHWNGSSFQSGYITVSMSAVDATNHPGKYYYDFNTNGLSDDTYLIYATTANSGVANKPWEGELKVGGYIDNIDASITSRATVTSLLAGVIESEGTYSLQQALSIILAAVSGVTVDGGLTFKTPNGNATRITAAVNDSDERTSITLNPSS